LRDNCERQAYTILKRRNFGHTKAFNLDLWHPRCLQD
jgi:hypothetical protein